MHRRPLTSQKIVRRPILLNWYGFKVHVWNVPLPLPGVYLVTNLINGKQYIGSTLNIETRFSNGWRQKGQGSRSLLGAAIQDDGHRSFLVEPIFYSYSNSKAFLAEAELSLIVGYDCLHPRGYNGVLATTSKDVFVAIGADPVLEAARIRGITAYAKSAEGQKRFNEIRTSEFQQRAAEGRRSSEIWRSAVTSPAASQRGVELSNKVLADPEIHAKRIASITRSWRDNPDRRQYQSEAIKAYLSDEDNYGARIAQLAVVQQAGSQAGAAVVRGSQWITDGVKGRRIALGQVIPDGWKWGKPDKRSQPRE
jgi:hypothetical protein